MAIYQQGVKPPIKLKLFYYNLQQCYYLLTLTFEFVYWQVNGLNYAGSRSTQLVDRGQRLRLTAATRGGPAGVGSTSGQVNKHDRRAPRLDLNGWGFTGRLLLARRYYPKLAIKPSLRIYNIFGLILSLRGVHVIVSLWFPVHWRLWILRPQMCICSNAYCMQL